MSNEPQPVPEIAPSWYDDDECWRDFCTVWRLVTLGKSGPGDLNASDHMIWMGHKCCYELHHPRKPEMSACEREFRKWCNYEGSLAESNPFYSSWLAFQKGWQARGEEEGR